MLPIKNVEAQQHTLSQLRDSSAEELAATLKAGTLDIVIDGALSEWGSALEDTLRKLENCVMQWREDGATKSLCIHFVETRAPHQASEAEDIIRLDSN